MNKNQFLSTKKTKNIQKFLLFFVITFLLWFIIQLTKTYSKTDIISIGVDNIPEDILLKKSNIAVNVSVNASGFNLWRYNFKEKFVIIPFQVFKKDSQKIILSKDVLKDKISKDYKISRSNISISEDKTSIEYRKKETKKVPIQSRVHVNFLPGYNSNEKVQISPDSILISGTADYLQSIKYLTTEEITVNDVNEDIEGVINIHQTDENIDLPITSVSYFLRVNKYTENNLEVDIEVINVPDSIKVSIFPRQAKLSYQINLDSFGDLTANDFRVVCDYTDRYEEDAIMLPSLVKFPKNILQPKLHVLKVDYLIQQK